MKSMTCYGSSTVKSDLSILESSIKSVNGRFLEIRVNVPSEFLKYENEIKKIISEKIERGTVTLFINRRKDPSKTQFKVQLKKDLVKKWSKAFDELSQEMGLTSKPSLDSFLQMKELFSIEESSDVSRKEEAMLFQSVELALKNCLKEKTREGLSIKKEISGFIKELKKNIHKISKFSHKQHSQLKKQYDLHVSHLTQNETIDQRLAQEIVTQMDRIDINEEISRFKEHLKSIQTLIREKSQVGKKLDFYTQELLREMNTVGSKSQMFQITQSVVESKTIIERLREQSQNVE